ncbi:MAG TPA: cyclic nucleotide-binding domain-containing protein [Mycobacteriales bacterium]|nr:cyclic nucleotide-binding domain-containing protein [Mycobacteriales bacterium]
MSADQQVVDALRKVDLFASVGDRALDKLAARTRRTNHAAGKVVTSEAQEAVGFHLILEGTAEVLVNGTVVGSLRPGDYFGEISLIDGGPRSATIRATEQLTTLALPAWDFAPLLDEEPLLTKNLLLAMCKRVRAAESR